MCRRTCCRYRPNLSGLAGHGPEPAIPLRRPAWSAFCRRRHKVSLRPCAGLAGHGPEPAIPLRRPAVNGSLSGLAGHGAEPAIPLRRPRHHPAFWDSRVTGLSPQCRCDAPRVLLLAGVGMRCPRRRVWDSRVTGLSPQSRSAAPLVNGNLSGLAGHAAEPAIPLRRPGITQPFGTRGSRA